MKTDIKFKVKKIGLKYHTKEIIIFFESFNGNKYFKRINIGSLINPFNFINIKKYILNKFISLKYLENGYLFDQKIDKYLLKFKNKINITKNKIHIKNFNKKPNTEFEKFEKEISTIKNDSISKSNMKDISCSVFENNNSKFKSDNLSIIQNDDINSFISESINSNIQISDKNSIINNNINDNSRKSLINNSNNESKYNIKSKYNDKKENNDLNNIKFPLEFSEIDDQTNLHLTNKSIKKSEIIQSIKQNSLESIDLSFSEESFKNSVKNVSDNKNKKKLKKHNENIKENSFESFEEFNDDFESLNNENLSENLENKQKSEIAENKKNIDETFCEDSFEDNPKNQVDSLNDTFSNSNNFEEIESDFEEL